MNYRTLFEEGRLGVKVSSDTNIELFLELFGEEAWQSEILRINEYTVVFRKVGGKLNAVTENYAFLHSLLVVDCEDFIKKEKEEIGYKELFQNGILGVRVTNLKDKEDMVIKYDLLNSSWEKTLNEDENKSEIVLCIYYGELCIISEDDEELAEIITYEEFVKEETNRTNDLFDKLKKLEQEIASIKQEIMEGK